MRFYNTFSRFFGLFCDFKFPHALQVMINKAYIKYFNIDMSEFKKVDEYSSLNSLFTRSLVCTRHICSDKNIVLSPSDGLCLELGESDNENVLCIKGKHYNILELLNQTKSDEDIKFTNDKSCEYTGNNQSLVKNEFIPNFPINYVNIYLSPQDYHHYHSPCDMKICAAKYIPGELKSVSKSWLKKYPSLYTTNERVILSCRNEYGRFWMVFVGALNVGRMKFDFDSTIQTNAKFGKEFTKKYDSLEIKMGEHLGNFELGSTIVLIFEGEVLDFKISPNEKIKFSQIIATFK